MKLKSRECREALERYETRDNIEEMAVKALKANTIRRVSTSDITGLRGPELLKIAFVMRRIRLLLNIED